MSCDVARRRPTILVPYLRFLHMEDSRRVSRILGNKDKGIARQPGESTVWGSAKKSRGYTPTLATTL